MTFVLVVGEPVLLGGTFSFSFSFSFYFIFCFLCFVFSVALPPGGQDSDAATTVDAVRKMRHSLPLRLGFSLAAVCCSRTASPPLRVFPLLTVVFVLVLVFVWFCFS